MRNRMISVPFTICALLICRACAEPPGDAKYEEPRRAKLEQLLREYDKALHSGTEKDLRKVMERMLATGSDGEKAFPKYAKAVGEFFEEVRKEVLADVDKGIEEERKGGKLSKVTVRDLRKKKKPLDRLRRALEQIPKEVDVVEVTRHFEGGTTVFASGAEFIFVNDRWVMVPPLEFVTQRIDEIGKKKSEKK